MLTLTLNNSDFNRLKDFIYSNYGISITDKKKILLESRLQKRLKNLGLSSFTEYCDYLFSGNGNDEELIRMVDEITTNKTDFFREPQHFEFLKRHAVPDLQSRQSRYKAINVWSAGCSSGEEPYTLAMVLEECGCRFFILATDISTKVLEKARLAVYDEERISPIPLDMKRKYLLKSKDPSKKLYRIVPELRECVRFRRINLMDNDFGFREPMDIIFCRNVIIYFDMKTKERLIEKFCNCLIEGGYLFMGHSETLFGFDAPLKQVAPTIYKRV